MKERFNPSLLSEFLRCAFSFYVTHELKLAPKPGRLIPHLTFGSLFHAASAACDLDPGSWRKAIRDECEKIRTSEFYKPEDSTLLDVLATEIGVTMAGGHYDTLDRKTVAPIMTPAAGYMQWKRELRQRRNWQVVEIERRYAVDLGGGIIAPKPDGVIREDGRLWVLERKTSQTTSEADFKHKFRTDLQTTVEVFAVEKLYGEEVAGVYVLPLFYTRSKSKLWDHPGIPQPLYRVTFDEPRPVPKSSMVKGAFELWFNQFIDQILPFYREHKLWPQNYRGCMIGHYKCKFYDVCWGQTQLSELLPIKDDDLYNALERIKEAE